MRKNKREKAPWEFEQTITIPVRSGGRVPVPVAALERMEAEFPSSCSKVNAIRRVEAFVGGTLDKIQQLIEELPRDADHLSQLFVEEFRWEQADAEKRNAKGDAFRAVMERRRSLTIEGVLGKLGK